MNHMNHTNHVHDIDHTNRWNHTIYNNPWVLVMQKKGNKHMNDIRHMNHMNYMGRIRGPWAALGAWEKPYNVQ